MKDYTTDSPSFHGSIKITETTDLAHPDNLNPPLIMLFENTLSLLNLIKNICDDSGIEPIFRQVFTKLPDETTVDAAAMTSEDIIKAISTEWSGEESLDPTAMTPGDITEAVSEEWDGEESPDPTAMTSEDVLNAIS